MSGAGKNAREAAKSVGAAKHGGAAKHDGTAKYIGAAKPGGVAKRGDAVKPDGAAKNVGAAKPGNTAKHGGASGNGRRSASDGPKRARPGTHSKHTSGKTEKRGGAPSPTTARNELSNPRALALSSLVKWRRDGKYTNLEVSASLGRAVLSEKDRSLYTALVYGVVERALTLDWVLSSLSSRPAASVDDETRCAVQLGLYQLMYMDRIPDHAAVSETVGAAPRRCRPFVNAILRAFIRADKSFELPSDPMDALSVRYSVPRALAELFRESYPDRYESLIASTLRRRPMTLRVNTLKTSVDEALSLLGESARRCDFAPEMITVSGESEVVLDGIARGLWFVQDASSRLAARVLGAEPGSLVADCCSAPGGKSFSIAIDMENRGDVRSFDLHENKISLIRDSAARLGIDIISASARDARSPDSDLVGRADRVLCDVPCSGLGVISKKPDIKYKDTAEFSRLGEVQYAILDASSAYVRPGGRLVYSTCTLNRAENECVFTRFLEAHPEFHPTDFVCAGKASSGGMLTFFPDEGEWDGFFVGCAVREKGAE